MAIEIEDNGCGLPTGFDLNEQTSLGMTLVQTLARQLEGEIKYAPNDPKQGTHFELSFQAV